MNDITSNDRDRDSLIEIYYSLAPSLQKQLITTAKIIVDTQNTLFDEMKDDENTIT